MTGYALSTLGGNSHDMDTWPSSFLEQRGLDSPVSLLSEDYSHPNEPNLKESKALALSLAHITIITGSASRTFINAEELFAIRMRK